MLSHDAIEEENLYEVVVVGAGPSGLTASIFAKNKKLKVAVLEGAIAGGQLKNLYPHKPVYNYPGYSQIAAGDLAEKMVIQARERDIPIIENAPVHVIDPEVGFFCVDGPNISIRAKGIILACGIGLFKPRKLGVPGEEQFEKHGLFYSIEDVSSWKKQRVAVAGGGNSAVDNCLLLGDAGSEVTLIHRLNRFQADEDSLEKLTQRNARVLPGWKILSLERGPGKRIIVNMENNGDRNREALEVDRVLVNIGLVPRIDFLESLPIGLEKNHVRVDSEMRTTFPGIFACGDITAYPGKVRLIVTAIGEAATAVNSLEKYLKSKENDEQRVAEEADE